MLKKLLTLILCLLPVFAWADNETSVNGQTADGHIVQNEGVNLAQKSYLNFVGSGVNVSNIGRASTVDLSACLTAESDPLSLHLDQTTQQTVTVNEPIFQEGIAVGDGNKTIKKIDESTVGLYVNGELIMSWNNIPDSGGAMGVMCLTYA